jgi:hypothetical protein
MIFFLTCNCYSFGNYISITDMGGILEYSYNVKKNHKNILPNSIYSGNMNLSFHTHLYLVP